MSENNIQVLKSNGTTQTLDYEKINKMVEMASDGLEDVSASQLAMNADLHMVDGITTKQIQNAMVDSAHNLISELNPGYQYAAARLFLVTYYKEVLGGHHHPNFMTHVRNMVDIGMYDPDILKSYSISDFAQVDKIIDYSRDYNFKYAGLRKLYDSYVIQDRTNGKRYETPQQRFMTIALGTFINEEPSVRMNYVKEFYDTISNFELSLPTPIMAGIGGVIKQYASCCLIRVGDSLKSITAGASAITMYGAMRAGIGIDAGEIRGLNSPVKGGTTSHTGVLPFYKKFHAAQSSCCVVPTTWVEVIRDEVPVKIQIKELNVGDYIKTMDEKTKEILYKEVTDKFVSEVPERRQRRLKFKNNTVLECSNNHPIMVDRNGELVEVMPDNLSLEDNIHTVNGYTQMYGIMVGRNNDPEYIDITVEDTHTFFCSDQEDQEMVLTHNSQGSIRKTSSTLFYPAWHIEFESLIVLKNNRGTEETRLRHIDYGVKMNRFLWERFVDNEDISLFSPYDVPGLYDAFHSDQDEFRRLYLEAEADPNIRRNTIPAKEMFNSIANERNGTGRIYIMNVDNVNNHGAFDPEKAPVYQSNLCMEIVLHNKPLNNVDDGYRVKLVEILDKEKYDSLLNQYGFIPRNREGTVFNEITNTDDIDDSKPLAMVDVEDKDPGEIALCILSSIDVGVTNTAPNIERVTRIATRALDNLIDLQEYPLKAGEISAKLRRTLGIGVTNFAYFLAKNGARYSDGTGKVLTHELFENIQYYLIKASAELAKERGPCEKFGDTRYSKGILPVDNYEKKLDRIVPNILHRDWDTLREMVLEYGMRHSTLSALMPVESSSVVGGCGAFYEKVPTSLGTLSFEELVKSQGHDYEDVISGNEGWYEVKDNITVTNRYGDEEDVTGIYFNGVKPVDEIVMEDGTTLHFTPDHKFLVDRDGEHTWVKVSELKEGDDIVSLEKGE